MVNDLGPIETDAHLLRYDSVHGRSPGEVKVDGDAISVGDAKVRVTAIKDPSELPWKDLGVDIALECTGIWRKSRPCLRSCRWRRHHGGLRREVALRFAPRFCRLGIVS